MHPSRTTRTCSPQRNASPPASPARPRGRVRMTDPPPWHTREPSAGRRQGPRSSLELGPDRLRVALAADEEPSRLIDTRCSVGLEALPYVLGVAGEHQGRPGLTVPVPIATAVQPAAASPPSAPCPGGAGDRRLAAPVLRPRCGVRPGRGPATEPGRPAPARSGARRPAPERELGGGDRPRYAHSAASTGHGVESRATRSASNIRLPTPASPHVLSVGLTHRRTRLTRHGGQEAQQADRRRSPWRVGAMSWRSLAHLAGASSLRALAAPHELGARRRCGTTSAAPRWRSGVAAP